jgi:hypothetical protein
MGRLFDSLSDDMLFIKAINALVRSRRLLAECVSRGLILGNDNHIGDIGEYLVMQYYKMNGFRVELAKVKNSDYDLLLPKTGDRVSVKTISEWSKHGKGTQVKPLDRRNNPWNKLAVVLLDERLSAKLISIISLEDLLKQKEFISNEKRRLAGLSKTYPVVNRNWSWLEEYAV